MADIKRIKQKLLNWRDFYGQDIADTEEIKKANSIKKLKDVVKKHITFLENQNIDALRHAEEFMDSISKEE
jgi:hypothetical protein